MTDEQAFSSKGWDFDVGAKWNGIGAMNPIPMLSCQSIIDIILTRHLPAALLGSLIHSVNGCRRRGDESSGGKITRTLYLSKRKNTAMRKYSVTSESPA